MTESPIKAKILVVHWIEHLIYLKIPTNAAVRWGTNI